MALSCFVTFSISQLRNVDIEANKFYDRAHRHYDATLLTMCYTQHALHPYIDSEINPSLSRRSHFVVSLSKTHYRLLNTGSTQEDPYRHD